MYRGITILLGWCSNTPVPCIVPSLMDIIVLHCREGYVEVAKILLEAGSDVETPDNYGQSPLFMACWKGDWHACICMHHMITMCSSHDPQVYMYVHHMIQVYVCHLIKVYCMYITWSMYMCITWWDLSEITSTNKNGGYSVGTLYREPVERLVFHYDWHEIRIFQVKHIYHCTIQIHAFDMLVKFWLILLFEMQ